MSDACLPGCLRGCLTVLLQASHPEVQEQVYAELQEAGLAAAGELCCCHVLCSSCTARDAARGLSAACAPALLLRLLE